MTITAPFPLHHYIALATKPYSEYIKGELFQKSVPTKLHSALQGWLTYLLVRALGSPHYQVLPEQNVQLSEQVMRIPDICVVEIDSPENDFALTTPPLLCVELISPSDRLSVTVKKCQEYLRWRGPYLLASQSRIQGSLECHHNRH